MATLANRGRILAECWRIFGHVFDFATIRLSPFFGENEEDLGREVRGAGLHDDLEARPVELRVEEARPRGRGARRDALHADDLHGVNLGC